MPNPPSAGALERLLYSLNRRDIPLSSDDVQWAFESVKTKDDITAWVNEYLNTETLLTKEELELYRSLTGRTSASKSNEYSSAVRPVHDEELATAINALESSTAVVKKQLGTLESQREALFALSSQSKASLSSGQRSRQELRRRRAQESVQLRLAIDDSISVMKEQLLNAQSDTDSARAATTAYATERLAGDDYALALLSDSGSILSPGEGSKADLESVDQWCRALAIFRASEVRSRVKTVYQTHLRDMDNALSISAEDAASQREALEGELETLFAEIASVAGMVVDHELRNPIVQRINRSKQEGGKRQREYLSYVISTLQYMISRLELLDVHVQNLQALQQALHELRSLSSSDLHDAVPKRESSPVKGSKPVNSTFRAGQPLLPPDTIGTIPEAARQLLRHFDVSALGNSAEEGRNSLRVLLSERQDKLRDQYRSAELSTDQDLGEHLHRCDRDLKAILGSLYSNSPYESVHVSNRALDIRLDDLGEAVESIGGSIARLDVEGAPESARLKREFISKWAA